MKISTKGRYALEAVIDLALNSKDGHESLKNVAERRKFSENYLEQIFVLLRKKGIVESIRGAQGGYKLTRDAAEITAGDVLRAAEGDFTVVPCMEAIKTGDESSCLNYNKCVTKMIWGKITDEVSRISDSVTVADLMECYKSIEEPAMIEYYI